jgi:UDP-N-acetylmuramate dehydrogenase
MNIDSTVGRALALLGPLAEQNVSLRTLTTFRIGGPADLLVRVQDETQFAFVRNIVRETNVQIAVVGQGSNLLVSDEGFRGLVIVLGGSFSEIVFHDEVDRSGSGGSDSDQTRSAGAQEELQSSDMSAEGVAERILVTAGSGVKLPLLARQAAARGLAGLEWMVGVPGSVGGAIKMNAGGHGSDTAANVVSARIWNTERDAAANQTLAELGLRYRASNLTANDVVLEATFWTQPGLRTRDEAENELSSIVRWRREHQPGGANCGSVYTNPPGDSAGRLIDAAHLRGYRIGTASVSEKHANFIQADDHGSSVDVWSLIVEVRRRVFETFGVVLHPEVRTLGFDATLPQLSTSPVDPTI